MNGQPQEEVINEQVPAYTDGLPQEGQQVDPELQKKVDTFGVVLIEVMHSDQTKQETLNMLKGEDETTSDPFIAIPDAAVAVNDMAVALMSDSGAVPDFAVQLSGSVLIINDLIQLGIASGLWDDLGEEDIKMIYEDTLQIVIERGLADGSIDPIQLQLDAEGFMDENQKTVGGKLALEKGLGKEPSQQAMNEQFAQGRERKVMKGATAKAAKDKQREQNQAMDLGGPR